MQGPNRAFFCKSFYTLRFQILCVVDNGDTKLSRAGQKIFGILNLQLPVWPRPFLCMGKILLLTGGPHRLHHSGTIMIAIELVNTFDPSKKKSYSLRL